MRLGSVLVQKHALVLRYGGTDWKHFLKQTYGWKLGTNLKEQFTQKRK